MSKHITVLGRVRLAENDRRLHLCYTDPMKRQRGIAILSALLVVMSVYLMITVMVADMRVELAATKMDSKALQQRYAARGACAEIAVQMGLRSGLRMQGYTKSNPYRLPNYDPPVIAWWTMDPRSENLFHLHTQSGNQIAERVFRKTAAAESQIFSALVGPDGMRLHSLAIRDLDSVHADPVGGDDPPPGQNAASSWQPVASPPNMVYAANGDLIPSPSGVANRYVADLRGSLYSVMTSDQGFAMYRYAGGQAWSRTLPRPALSFSPATGSLTATGQNYLGNSQTPVWEVSRDASDVWFAENVEPGSGAPSGSSYLQRYDTNELVWQSLEIPSLALTPGIPERFKVKDIAAGEDGQIFLLTEPTAACPDSRVVSYDGLHWSVLARPPRRYFRSDSKPLVSTTGNLPIESIAVGGGNVLYAASPAEADIYAISKFGDRGWDLGVDRRDRAAALPSRDFNGASGFRPLSVDASGKVILAANGGGAPVMRGAKEDDTFRDLPSLKERALPGEKVWSNIGGGIAGTTSNTFKSTAEY